MIKDNAHSYRTALAVCREMIRGRDLEHAVVDIAEMDVGLGKYIDRVLAQRAGPAHGRWRAGKAATRLRDCAALMGYDMAPGLVTAAGEAADALENFIGICNAWKRDYDGEKARGDAWMADCKKAERDLAVCNRSADACLEEIDRLRAARDASSESGKVTLGQAVLAKIDTFLHRVGDHGTPELSDHAYEIIDSEEYHDLRTASSASAPTIARNDIIEECAKVCDAQRNEVEAEYEKEKESDLLAEAVMANYCASAIRELKDKPTDRSASNG